MTAQQLISDSIIPLRTSETGDTALGIMNDFYVRHLPIVNDKQLLGLISEEDILEHDAHEPVVPFSFRSSARTLSITITFTKSCA